MSRLNNEAVSHRVFSVKEVLSEGEEKNQKEESRSNARLVICEKTVSSDNSFFFRVFCLFGKSNWKSTYSNWNHRKALGDRRRVIATLLLFWVSCFWFGLSVFVHRSLPLVTIGVGVILKREKTNSLQNQFFSRTMICNEQLQWITEPFTNMMTPSLSLSIRFLLFDYLFISQNLSSPLEFKSPKLLCQFPIES